MAKSSPIFKKFVVIAIGVIGIQTVFLFFYKQQDPTVNFREAMNRVVNQDDGLGDEKRILVKVKMAISDYRVNNDQYPVTLDDLVPTYFKKVPINPETGQEFLYKQGSTTYKLGEDAVNQAAPAEQGKSVDEMNKRELLIASLDKEELFTDFIYDSKKKRDPFQTYDFTPIKSALKGGTPLEQYTYKDLRVTAILLGMGKPKAIIEGKNKKGHTAELGTKIGPFGGKVVKIEDDKVTILETTVEFTGEKSNRTVELFLRK